MAGRDLTLSLTAPAAAGNLRVIALSAHEEISTPFLVRLSLISDRANIDPDSMIDQPFSVTIERENAASRHFHGIARAFAAAERVGGGGDHAYEAEIVPSLWFLNHIVDCRVFHNKTTKDIVQTILSESNVSHQFMIVRNLANRIFSVQYNESNLSFLNRLLEEDGLYFFFEHGAQSHLMTIADNNQAFSNVALPQMALTSGGGGISSWKVAGSAAMGNVALRGYNAKVVAPVEGVLRSVRQASGKDRRSVNLWPTHTRVVAVAAARARVHQEAADAVAALYQGTSQNHSFCAGGKFKLTANVLQTNSAGDYVLRSVSHHAQDARYTSLGGGVYSNQFTAFPIGTVWRQPPVTPRPYMAGIHLAVVLGPPGEEIYVTGVEGRIRVRFLWDHRRDATEQNTIEVRVMQPWSGNGWGMQHIPRVGTEVAVAFINGDPDDPVVIGSLYNGTHKHPWQLPAEKTKSGIKTRSTLKGGAADFNELFFDDKKGSELVSLRAQKDHKVVVENDQTSRVMRHLRETVDGNRTRAVGGNETVKVTGKQTETVKGNRIVEITEGNDSLTVKMGSITIKADLGSITVEAMQSIELKVGGNSVKIDQTGVTIKGLMVKIEAQTMMGVKGVMTTVEGSAMTTVKGGLVLIN